MRVMRLRWTSLLAAFAAVCLMAGPRKLRGQDASPVSPDPVVSPSAPMIAGVSPATDRDVSWEKLPLNFLHDQENIWLFPVKVAKGRHWVPTIAVVGATAGLLAADPHDQPYFNHTTAFHGFDQVFSSKVTGVETIAVPAAFYLVGLGRHDSYMQKTALFAGEAVLDSEMIRMAMNSVTARWRPSDVAGQKVDNDTFFRNNIHVGSSFPSGHTIAAFAVATVIARRYRNHRWVPYVAYGLAGTVGFSRITLRTHFPSDVFLGAALGYATARYAVLQGR